MWKQQQTYLINNKYLYIFCLSTQPILKMNKYAC